MIKTQVQCQSKDHDGILCLKINGHIGTHGCIGLSGAWHMWII